MNHRQTAHNNYHFWIWPCTGDYDTIALSRSTGRINQIDVHILFMPMQRLENFHPFCMQKTPYLSLWLQLATKKPNSLLQCCVELSTCLVVDKNKVSTRIRIDWLAARLINDCLPQKHLNSSCLTSRRELKTELCSGNHFSYHHFNLLCHHT